MSGSSVHSLPGLMGEAASGPKSLVQPPDESHVSTQPEQLSKNALKKAAKAERLAALKTERRAREKEVKKEKKRQRAEKRAAGELEDDEIEEEERKRRTKKPKLQFGGTVLIDLGFDDMMNDKEIVSLCSQLAYTYSANRQASFPFSLICSSVNGRTYERLDSLGDASYKRWANTEWWAEGYERLWIGRDNDRNVTSTRDLNPGDLVTSDPRVPEEKLKIAPGASPLSSKENVVYLTADAEEELVELNPNETYIIGGICDHNRYKNLCLNKAKESDVRTARLPIGRYLSSMPTRKVLTVNQVFEILVKWIETRDWEESLYSVIPKRKFQQGGKGNQNTNINGTTREGDADVDEHPHLSQP